MALVQLAGPGFAGQVEEAVAGSVERWTEDAVWIKPGSIAEVARFLYDDESLDFQFLNSISAVDYIGHFELVYHLTSFRHRHKTTIKAVVQGRGEPLVPSVYQVWRGADFQEREVWDLMGIRFEGHPNLKRIMLWEGFEGHPLRKDYL